MQFLVLIVVLNYVAIIYKSAKMYLKHYTIYIEYKSTLTNTNYYVTVHMDI